MILTYFDSCFLQTNSNAAELLEKSSKMVLTFTYKETDVVFLCSLFSQTVKDLVSNIEPL